MSKPDVIAFVRTDETTSLPAPAGRTGFFVRLRENYFASIPSALVTLVLSALLLMLAWQLIGFALINAVWTGENGASCAARDDGTIGACWPFVSEKFGQWIYGFYPLDQRWRIDLIFIALVTGAIPLLVPAAPFKRLNLAYLGLVFPVLAFVLMTGGHFAISSGVAFRALSVVLFGALALPVSAYGFHEGLLRNRWGVAFAAAATFLWVFSAIVGMGPQWEGIPLDVAILLGIAAALSVWTLLRDQLARRHKLLLGWLLALVWLVATLAVLMADLGLASVATSQWGGLSLTLIISVTGIVTSLPIGIVLALGRQSKLPAVRTLSICFIELIRGVPLIAVLFMASVMLPLFLPPGMSVDKLLRALVGVALFASAYMAEVVRGGLQAVPRGQYEGATALGLSYWQIMVRVVLPQALKVSIPNIVSNFIVLFKDTTLVLIVGLFDLLAIAQTGIRDANWSSPATAATGYLVLALIYWAFCFGMSRYALFTERRLHTDHRS